MTTWPQWLELWWRGMALHLWQTSLVLLALAPLGYLLRRAPARRLQALGWIAVLKLLVPLTWLEIAVRPLLDGAQVDAVVGPSRLATYVSVAMQPRALSGAASSEPIHAGSMVVAMTAVWLVGMVILLALGARRRGVVASRAPVDRSGLMSPVQAKLAAALSAAGIPASRVRVFDVASTPPGVVGFLRPIILVPQRAVAALSVDELRAVLLHEEAHRRRYEPLRALVLRVVLLLFWFYPPLWWLVGRLQASAELACDESVLERGVGPGTYATALCRALSADAIVSPLAVTLGRPAGLRQRLERIERPWRYREMKHYRWLIGVAVSMLIGACLIPVVSGGERSPVAEPAPTLVPGPSDAAWFPELERLAGADAPLRVELGATTLELWLWEVEYRSGVRIDVEGKLPDCRVEPVSGTFREALERVAIECGLAYEVPNPQRLIVRVPVMAGIDRVTNPVLIEDSKVEVDYPERARRDGIAGRVILQAVVRKDGTVGALKVLREVRGYPEFAENAVRAVRQWRYVPAQLDGRPIDVVFTVFIEFKSNPDLPPDARVI